jgi:hypothetical protein
VTVPQLHAPDSDPPKALLAGAKSKPSIAPSGREVIWKSSLTILAKPDGASAGYQPSTLTDKQSSLLTPIATNA